MAKPDRRGVLLAVGVLLALALTFVFGYRAGRHIRYLRWENEPIRPWMSIPFIAHAHHVDPQFLYQSVGVDPRPHDHRPVRFLARQQHRPAQELIDRLNTALANSQSKTP